MNPELIHAAAELLAAITLSRQAADRRIQAYFRERRKLGSKERGFIAETVYGCLRHKRSLEYGLGELTTDALNVVAAYLVSAQGWSARALEQAGFDGDARALVAQLRGVDKENIPAAVRADLPDWIYERLVAELSAVETQRLAAALNRPAPVDLRVNSLKAKREAASALLAEQGYPTEPTSLSPVGLRRIERDPLFKTRAFQEGWIEVQDEGSQLLALLLEPKRGEMVVDFCAGAGGKTLHLGALMGNTGTLYALDVSEKRLEKIKPRLKRAGLDTVHTLIIEHERDRRVQRLRGKIDRVLVDAPCTGIGTLRRNPDIKWRAYDMPSVTDLQGRILAAAAELLKPGGRLVYATCSPLREENEAVVESFLAANPAFQALPIAVILQRKNIPLPCEPDERSLRLYTHVHGTDSFFAMVLQRDYRFLPRYLPHFNAQA